MEEIIVSAQLRDLVESFFSSVFREFLPSNMAAMLDYASAWKGSTYSMFMAVTGRYRGRIGHRSA